MVEDVHSGKVYCMKGIVLQE